MIVHNILKDKHYMVWDINSLNLLVMHDVISPPGVTSCDKRFSLKQLIE